MVMLNLYVAMVMLYVAIVMLNLLAKRWPNVHYMGIRFADLQSALQAFTFYDEYVRA